MVPQALQRPIPAMSMMTSALVSIDIQAAVTIVNSVSQCFLDDVVAFRAPLSGVLGFDFDEPSTSTFGLVAKQIDNI
ncbi:MAG TPA: hypothetical protein VK436_08365 [Methanocella sp.]|nr:hypothetical protein [Methanocella sp.]